MQFEAMYQQRLSRKQILVFFFVYAFLILIARHLSVISFKGPPAFWPASGLLYAYFTFTRFQDWPKLAGLSICAWAAANALSEIPTSFVPWFWFSSTTSQLLGVCLYLYGIRNREKSEYAAVFGFIFVGGVAVPALMAALNTYIVGFIGLEPVSMMTWRYHFAATSLGILTISPFTLFLLRETGVKAWFRRPDYIDVGLLLLVGAVTFFVFGPWSVALEFRSIFFIYPFMGMIALRGKFGLTASANLLIAFIGIAQTLEGFGPFREMFSSPLEVMTSLQFFVVACTLTLTLLTVAISGRKKLAEDLVSRGQELERLNEDLIRAKQSAFEASEAKSRFLADMSHEIRSPLGAMTGFAELILAENATTDDRKRYAQIIKRNGLHLGELVNQILDISKIEAGKFEIEAKPIVVRDFFESVVELMEIKAREKGLSLKLIFTGEIPIQFSSDPLRLRQILLNSIGNAIKFTSVGGVTVRVRTSRDFAHPTKLTCEIRDTGVGIDPDDQKRLFQAYSQASASTARLFGGTGLGLTLSRQLAKLLGGNYELVSSVKGEGSTFKFFVVECLTSKCQKVQIAPSVSNGAPRTVSAPSKQMLTGRRILVADDSVDSQLLVRLFLESEGAIIETCGDGLAAVELALSRKFDLILMDCEMPKMNGVEAMSTLRNRGYRGLVVAMTGHAMPNQGDQLSLLGFDAHILKPIEKLKLISRISGLIRQPLLTL